MAWAVEHHQSRHGFVSAPLSALLYITVKTGVMGLETAVRVKLLVHEEKRQLAFR